MNEELKSLIEDVAKLLGVEYDPYYGGMTDEEGFHPPFNPCDPERGDLMKVLIELLKRGACIDGEICEIELDCTGPNGFYKGDYQSLALAILRAASAVYKSRGV